MRLVVVSHKVCWRSAASPSGYATNGGFAFQMRALSQLFDATTIVVPCAAHGSSGEALLDGLDLSIAGLTLPSGTGLLRKLLLGPWLLFNLPTLWREVRRADAVHAPIPGDIGTLGMVLGYLLRKPLLVRHCGNWLVQQTAAERFWRWFIERNAGGRNVMLVTGGGPQPPSPRNSNVQWIFSTSLTEAELEQRRRIRRPAPGAQLRLIIVCRQDREKGTGVVIESLPLIRRQYPQVSLAVVGEGEALPQFQELAVRVGVQDQVTFHGNVGHDTVLELLTNADLFCYPTSASEGFPKAVLEALACGLPVITTRVSVLPQLLAGGSGILIDEAAPAALAQAVHECVLDPGRYLAMSERAIQSAQQYSLERWAETIGCHLEAAWGALRSTA